jgi:hypothetical protein
MAGRIVCTRAFKKLRHLCMVLLQVALQNAAGNEDSDEAGLFSSMVFLNPEAESCLPVRDS